MTTSSRNIGNYRLVAGLGQGGMARVYLAVSQKQSGFTKLLVLKILRTDLSSDADFLQMFLAEASIAARLNHPHVVQTYEVGEDAGRHFMAMEYLEGQPLSTVLKRVGRAEIPLDLHVRILCDLLEGLQYLHELADFDGTLLNPVHRDVSPQNVFVTYTGQSKLLDFGIAKVSGTTRTQQGLIKGKTGYMAPEQARGGKVDRRTDLFAVGVMLWEALAGRRLVEKGEDDVSALTRRITGLDPRVRTVKADVDEELAAICDRAMAHEPVDRYATATEMRDALEAWLRPKHADARAVAAFLDKSFADDRAQMRKLIEEQLAAASQTGPMIDLFTRGTVTPPSADGVLIDVETQAAPAPTPTSARRSPAVYWLLGGGVAIAVAVAATLARSPSTKPAAAVATPSAIASIRSDEPAPTKTAAVEATPDAAAPAASVTLTFEVTPHHARIDLDGQPVRDPHSLTVARDPGAHLVRVTAAGYTTAQRPITLDRDQQIAVALERAGGAAPAAATTSDVGISTQHNKRDLRRVDDKDPYQ